VLTSDAAEIMAADKVVFPGVGEASSAMEFLKEAKLDKVIKSLKQPVLGICLGMQLMCKSSEEGNVECLGIFDQQVKKFNIAAKVPQVGWNNIYNLRSKLFEGVDENSFVYFVHSYYCEQGTNAIATANYGLEYCPALQKDNFYAVQFHPEKSAETGELILSNFLKL